MDSIDDIFSTMNALPNNASRVTFLAERIRILRSRDTAGSPDPQIAETLHRLSIHLEELQRKLAIETERQIPTAALNEGAIASISANDTVQS